MKKGQGKKKMNIVWFVQDHVMWKHFRDTDGPKPKLPTYERIAKTGIEFNRAYSIIPLCGPARGSLMTGVYPHKHGIINNGKKVDLNQLEINVFNKYLIDEGYRTGYFGKWHAGVGVAQDSGFEGYSVPGYGNPYGTDEYLEYLQKHNLPTPFVDVEWRPTGEISKNVDLTVKGISPHPKVGIGHPTTGIIKAPAETTESYFLSDMASEWLQQRVEDGDSFFLRVDTWGPHQPYLVSETFKDTMNPTEIPEYPNFSNDFGDRPAYHKRDREEWRAKTGFTTWEEWQPIVGRAYEHYEQTDTGLGKILDTLEHLGIAEETIVIYTADHGDILASNGGLFDKDSMLTEETMSIPMVIRWPGVTDGKYNRDELVSNMDLVPTILEMAGIQVPTHMDGESIVPLLNQNPQEWREELLTQHFGHINHYKIQRVLYWKNYKYVAHLDDTDELYNLEKDPFEWKNLVEDPALDSLLQDMKKRLARCMVKYQDLSEDSQTLLKQKGITI
ncbi:sulfatase-like hydrolase/transferase [Lederbergia graminis]|uniref:Sulfatase-like hydrolase/transferase n=1 Tax=Lederbergia graminis TaxID=735518 RepID=A0ABW0LHX0_9BACI